MKITTSLLSAALLLPLVAACDNLTGDVLDGADSSTSSSDGMMEGDSSSVLVIDLTASSSSAEAMMEKSSADMAEEENTSGAAYVAVGCKVAGCSGQLCVEEGMEDIVTTCEWREEYACYRTARCEKQATGVCGWRLDAELTACLSAGSDDVPPADSVQ
ncbi:hypothetical protein HYZ99_02255 [Candidatus Peregrinibacteria bacterium]|nr:hypothetical protein [Candidatus Peregrinibacteria bacterium]